MFHAGLNTGRFLAVVPGATFSQGAQYALLEGHRCYFPLSGAFNRYEFYRFRTWSQTSPADRLNFFQGITTRGTTGSQNQQAENQNAQFITLHNTNNIGPLVSPIIFERNMRKNQ